MARVQVGKIERPGVKPVSSPVDTFKRTAAGTSVSQLAEALSGIAPELRAFTDTVVEGQKQGGRKYADELIAAGKQIKANEIAPHESQYFRMAAKEQFGRLNAGQFASRLTSRMSDPNDPLNQSTDPADFDAAVAEERSAYLAEVGGEGDHSFMAGFNASSNEEVAARREAFARQAGARMESQVIQNTLQEHSQQIENGIVAGKTMQEIAQGIYERNTIQYALNPKSGNALSNTMRQAVYLTAEKLEDESVLRLLDFIPGGPKNSMLSSTKLSLEKTPEVLKSIRAARQQRYNLESTEDRNERKEQVEVALGDMFDAIDKARASGQSLQTIDPRTFADTVMPSDAQRVYRAFAAAQRMIDVDDEAVANGLWNQAFRSTLTYDDVANAYENGHLTDETARKMRTEIKRNRSGQGAAKFLTKDQRLMETKQRLFQRFIDQYGINAPNVKLRAEAAVQKLENAWIMFKRTDQGMNASEDDVNAWLHEAGNTMFIDNATPGLRKALKGVDLPESTGIGPQVVDWKKQAVVPPYWLGQLSKELDKYETTPNFRLPPSVEWTLNQLGIKNIAQAREFLQRQREFIPVTK